MRTLLGLGAAMIAAPLLMGVHHAQAATESILHVFNGANGQSPSGALVRDAAGNLYGTAGRGGTVNAACPTLPPVNGNTVPDGCGLVFRLSPPAAGKTAWTETILYKFSGPDGSNPSGDLVFDKAGNLYGTTTSGGEGASACPGSVTTGAYAGCGLVFQLAPPRPGKPGWTQTTLHRFTNADGSLPAAGLVIDAGGHLYGTTPSGGGANAACRPNKKNSVPGGCGVVFELTPPKPGRVAWTIDVLHRFAGGADGSDPAAKLFRDSAGNLYGTTVAGGLTPATCAADPSSSTEAGCGVIFRLKPPAAGKTAWTEAVLHRFAGNAGGSNPIGALVADKTGNLYGTTYLGGTSSLGPLGTVFKLAAPAAGKAAWVLSILHDFGKSTGSVQDGAYPYAGLLITPSGTLFGTTTDGGNNRQGTVFRVTPPPAGKTAWGESVLHSFTVGTRPDGYLPYGGLIRDAAGNLYGTTLAAAIPTAGQAKVGDGTVFRIAP
jgi:hypothetical protein